jgi:arginyl-tRNA synthetase
MKEHLQEIVTTCVEGIYQQSSLVVIERTDDSFGDFSTNIALRLSGVLGEDARSIAENITTEINATATDYSASVAGPGFINIRVQDSLLQKTVADIIAKDENFGTNTLYSEKLLVAEYSDPNPFKVLHAGHLYTTLVGDAISRLLEAAGAEVKRVNFGGDVGLHVAKAMWGIIRSLEGEYSEKLESMAGADRAAWISECYVQGNLAYEEDETKKAEIVAFNKRIYELHQNSDKESAFARIYWTCRQWSYDGFDEVYKALEVHGFDKYYPESMTVDIGKKIVEEGLEKGVFKRSDGAIVYDGEKDGLHTRVFITSEGLPTYEAKDLGLAVVKWEDYKFDLSLMITGNDIVEYMKVVQAASRHFYPEITERTKHITHGMIKLPGGEKMSSRKGNVLLAEDILSAAKDAYVAQTSQEERSAVLAAVKYSFLKNRIGGDIVYDPKESVNILGNSGPYLQYAHARARSIMAKSTSDTGSVCELDSSERLLVRKMSMYPEVVAQAAVELMPHHLCAYLYELAQEFNSFYESNRVLGDPRESQRLTLVRAYAQVLKNGLSILGIQAPEKM